MSKQTHQSADRYRIAGVRRTIYSHCPNVDCAYHAEAPAHWYWSKGTFVTKWNHQPVPRYQCKKCRRTFSSHTFREIYKQKKPYLNEPIRQALTEAMAIRGVARSLKVSKTTVLHRLKFLGEQSKKVCEAKWAIAEAKTSYVQFDELETSERTQCLPITIAFAVQVRTGHIITARVGKVPCDNALQRVSLENFGYREDQREQTVRTMLRDIKKVVKDEDSFLIASDKHPSYSK